MPPEPAGETGEQGAVDPGPSTLWNGTSEKSDAAGMPMVSVGREVNAHCFHFARAKPQMDFSRRQQSQFLG